MCVPIGTMSSATVQSVLRRDQVEQLQTPSGFKPLGLAGPDNDPSSSLPIQPSCSSLVIPLMMLCVLPRSARRRAAFFVRRDVVSDPNKMEHSESVNQPSGFLFVRDIQPEQLSLFNDDDVRGGLAEFYLLSPSLYTVHIQQLLHLLLASSSSYIFSSSSTRHIYIYGRIYIVTPHYSNPSGVLLQSMAFAS